MLLKDNSLKCYFINKPESPYFESSTFKQILSFIQTQTNKARLKQVGRLFLLIVDSTKTMEGIHSFLMKMDGYVHDVSLFKV
jgi:transcription-repair coupling factor (superfamily II helicase)